MNLLKIIEILCLLESDGRADAYNKAEDAAGILQIRMCVVEDVNRILGKDVYVSEDRWDVEKSKQMAQIYLTHYCTRERLGHEPTVRDYAATWNGGPRGPFKANARLQWYASRAERMHYDMA